MFLLVSSPCLEFKALRYLRSLISLKIVSLSDQEKSITGRDNDKKRRAASGQSDQPHLLWENIPSPIKLPEETRKTLIEITSELIAVYWQETKGTMTLLPEDNNNHDR